jgi:hypothetical protein
MRKLKLESLTVESFETAASPRQRGTVAAHVDIDADGLAAYPGTINPDACGPTNYLDCTYGCSLNTRCFYNTCIAMDAGGCV